MNPHTAFSMSATADYTPPPRNGINFGIAQTYEIRYSHPDGSGWVEYIHNLIPNVALNTMLDKVTVVLSSIIKKDPLTFGKLTA